MWPIMFVVNSCLQTDRCYRHCKISVPAEILILELWMCWPDKFASWVCVKCKAINGRITAAHSTHRLHWTGCPTSASSVSLFTSSDMLLAQVSSHQSRRGILQMHREVCCIPMNSLPPFHLLYSLVGNDNRFMLQFLGFYITTLEWMREKCFKVAVKQIVKAAQCFKQSLLSLPIKRWRVWWYPDLTVFSASLCRSYS